MGEVDIIAEKGGVVRFIEVKSVSREPSEEAIAGNNTHRPEELVHQSKLRKIARTAEVYMNDKKDQRDFQIDVVAVFLDLTNRRAKCRFFEQVL